MRLRCGEVRETDARRDDGVDVAAFACACGQVTGTIVKDELHGLRSALLDAKRDNLQRAMQKAHK